MFSRIDWYGLAIIVAAIAALGFGVQLVPDGWMKSTLRLTFFAILFVVGAVLLWNFFATRFGLTWHAADGARCDREAPRLMPDVRPNWNSTWSR